MSFSRDWTGTECCARLDAPRFAAKPRVQGRLASGEEFGPFCEYAPTAARFKPRHAHSASLAGQAMNRYRGTQAEFRFSIVAPHTAHSKLLISRSALPCARCGHKPHRIYRIDDRILTCPQYALRTVRFPVNNPVGSLARAFRAACHADVLSVDVQ